MTNDEDMTYTLRKIREAYATGLEQGMVVGAAIIAWAEAIRTRTLTQLESYKLAELALRVDAGTFVTEACRASGHTNCLSHICGCPCHE